MYLDTFLPPSPLLSRFSDAGSSSGGAGANIIEKHSSSLFHFYSLGRLYSQPPTSYRAGYVGLVW